MIAAPADLERPCTHKRVRHEHGDYKRYQEDRCRCVPCTAAHRDRARQLSRDRAYGLIDQRWTDAAPVLAHLAELKAAGMGYKKLAQAAQMTPSRANTLLNGRGKKPPVRIRTDVAARVLAVRADLDTLHTVPGHGVRRRIEALMALGWPLIRLAQLLDVDDGNFGRTIRAERVEASTHRAVAALYETLWDQRPTPVTGAQRQSLARTLNTARARGYLPPLAWDDIDTDVEPPRVSTTDSVVVDPVAVQRLVDGLRPAKVTRGELLAAVNQLHDRGLSDADIGARIQMGAAAVHKLRRRAEARELARLVHAGVQLNAAATLIERRTA